MKHARFNWIGYSSLSALLVASTCLATDVVLAQQVPIPQTAADVTAPATGVTMHPEYAKAVGRMAYIWGWPMVNQINRRAAITQAPEPGRLNGVLPVAPRGQIGMLSDYIDPGQNFVTCPNQDVVYGLGFFSLDEEPVVIQVPDFGDRFWVYAMYDARTDQFAEIGKPYNTKPGFYLIVGPKWKGEKPAGIEAVVRSSTALANAIPRVFMDDTAEDRKAIQPVDQPDRRLSVEGLRRQDEDQGLEQGAGDSRSEIRRRRRDGLGRAGEVLRPARRRCCETVAPLPGEEALYGQFRALLDAAAKDPAIKQALVEAAVETEKQGHRAVPRVEAQRPSGRQRLESLDQQCAVRRRLLQPHRHGEVEHVRQQADRDAIFLHRRGFGGRLARRQEQLRDHVRAGTGAAGQRLLVADALQRRSTSSTRTI